MTKKQIKQLVLESLDKNNNLDINKIDTIADKLDRRELKDYIKTLKKWEEKNSIIITLPKLPTEEDKKRFLNLFPDKKIVYNIDPSLLVGIRIKNNDLITEINLKDSINHLARQLYKIYD